MKKYPFYLKFFYSVLIIYAIIVIAVLISTKGIFGSNRFTENEVKSFNQDWFLESGEVAYIPSKTDYEAGKDFVLIKKVNKDLKGTQYMMFYTDHSFVKTYINDKLVYDFGYKKQIPFGKTAGSGWQLIPLHGVKSGDEIKLVINSPYNHYSGRLRNILIGTKAQLISHIMWDSLIDLILLSVPFLLGIILILVPPFLFWGYKDTGFFNIGIAFLILAVWSFSETRNWQLFFVNNFLMQVINFLCFMLMAPSLLLAMHSLGFVKNEKVFKKMMVIDTVIPLLVVLLQLLNLVDIFDSLILIHIMMFATQFIFAYTFIKGLKKDAKLYKIFGCIIYATIVLFTIIDIFNFYTWDIFTTGFFVRISYIVLISLISFMGMKRAIVMHEEKIQQEMYEKMAYTDKLTGLGNKRAFDEYLQEIEKRKEIASIVYIDMNGLKWINDNKGHHMGDEAIKMLARKLVEFKTNVYLAYRLGGDEFCVITFEKNEDKIDETCVKINEELKKFKEDYGDIIGISYGIQLYDPKKKQTIQECVRAADEKMFQYKKELYKTVKKYR